MKKSIFHVVENLSKIKLNKFPCFVLERSAWDDYGLKSTFYLHYFENTKKSILIGQVKILKQGHTYGAVDLPNNFINLTPEYCSLGTTYEYYENLEKILGKKKGKELLDSLKDLALSDSIFQKFHMHDGYKSSLVRSNKLESLFDEVKKTFKSKNTNKVSELSRDFSFIYITPIAKNSEHILDFDFEENKLLPFRINVIVGKNGVGKTTFLSNLATDLVGEIKERPSGYFLGELPKFRNIIAVSYNPFDNFFIPKTRGKDREVTSKSDGFFFGYKYIGIRKRLLSNEYVLKSFEELSKEFRNALDKIESLKKVSTFFEYARPIFLDSSFSELIDLNDVGKLKLEFKKLSAGQKFVLLSLARLFLNTKKYSLILLDEPENHLHPAIALRFIQSISNLLEARKSYAIISTHSPIILQEIPSRYVKVLERRFDVPVVTDLNYESYGGSLNEITNSIFKLSVEDFSFESLRERIINENMTIDELKECLINEPNLRMKSAIREL